MFLPTGTSMDDFRPTIGLAKRLMRQKGAINKVMLVLSKTVRSERQVEQALATIESSGFECLSAMVTKRILIWARPVANRATLFSSSQH